MSPPPSAPRLSSCSAVLDGVLILVDCAVVRRPLFPPHPWDAPPLTAPASPHPTALSCPLFSPAPSRAPPRMLARSLTATSSGGACPQALPAAHGRLEAGALRSLREPPRRVPWVTVSRETEPAPATDTGYETHLCGSLWGPCASSNWPDALPLLTPGFVGLGLGGQGGSSSGFQGGGA